MPYSLSLRLSKTRYRRVMKRTKIAMTANDIEAHAIEKIAPPIRFAASVDIGLFFEIANNKNATLIANVLAARIAHRAQWRVNRPSDASSPRSRQQAPTPMPAKR